MMQIEKEEGERDRDTDRDDGGRGAVLGLGGTLVQGGKVVELYRKGVKG